MRHATWKNPLWIVDFCLVRGADCGVSRFCRLPKLRILRPRQWHEQDRRCKIHWAALGVFCSRNSGSASVRPLIDRIVPASPGFRAISTSPVHSRIAGAMACQSELVCVVMSAVAWAAGPKSSPDVLDGLMLLTMMATREMMKSETVSFPGALAPVPQSGTEQEKRSRATENTPDPR